MGVSTRLGPVTFREDTMIAAYSGEDRARYLKHLDNDRNAVITALFYLNVVWQVGHGGEIRLYMPGMDSNDIKAQIQPISNRLVLFWSNEDNPHEVLHALRDRYAMTIWYVDGSQALACPDGLSKLVCEQPPRLNPVSPLTLKEALSRSGHKGYEAECIIASRMRQAAEVSI